MPDPITLRGQRVRLTPLSEDHIDGLLSAATESRDTFDFTRVPADHASMRTYVHSALVDQQTGWALPFAVWDQTAERIVGATRFLDLDYWSWPPSWPPGRATARPDVTAYPSVAEIGSTWLAASAQGTGLNAEMKILMLEHAFDTWHVHRVTFKTDARNQRSRTAIERIGGRFEGIRRAHARAVDGNIRDSAYFSILAEEWPTIRSHAARKNERRE